MFAELRLPAWTLKAERKAFTFEKRSKGKYINGTRFTFEQERSEHDYEDKGKDNHVKPETKPSSQCQIQVVDLGHPVHVFVISFAIVFHFAARANCRDSI